MFSWRRIGLGSRLNIGMLGLKWKLQLMDIEIGSICCGWGESIHACNVAIPCASSHEIHTRPVHGWDKSTRTSHACTL